MQCFVILAALLPLMTPPVIYGAPQVPAFSYSYATVNYQSAPLVQSPLVFNPAKQQFQPPQTEVSSTEAEEVALNATTTEEPAVRTADSNSTTEAEAEQISAEADSEEKNAKLAETAGNDNDNFAQQGVYYIYHPSGLLQRIVYSAKNDVESMGYTAQLKYQDVEPIREPIFTYDPNTLVLQPLQI